MVKAVLLSILLLIFLTGCEDKEAPTKDIVTFNNKRFTNNLVVEKVIPQKFITSKESIDLIFSAPLNKELFSIFDLQFKDKLTQLPVEVEFQIVKNHFQITSITPLEFNKTYILTIKDSLQDNVGNTLKQIFVHEFVCIRNFIEDYNHRNMPLFAKELESQLNATKTKIKLHLLEDPSSYISTQLSDSENFIDFTSYLHTIKSYY